MVRADKAPAHRRGALRFSNTLPTRRALHCRATFLPGEADVEGAIVITTLLLAALTWALYQLAAILAPRK